jgi:hypothetical protein
MRLPVYVPNPDALPTIPPGAGIIGAPAYPIDPEPGSSPADLLLIEYEDNHAETIRTFADRVRHAAARHLTGGPTAKRLLVNADDLLVVGSFGTKTARIEVTNPQTLQAWLAQPHEGPFRTRTPRSPAPAATWDWTADHAVAKRAAGGPNADRRAHPPPEPGVAGGPDPRAGCARPGRRGQRSTVWPAGASPARRCWASPARRTPPRCVTFPSALPTGVRTGSLAVALAP